MATAAVRDLDSEYAIVGTISDNDPQKPYYLKAIADLFTERFRRTRNKSDLDNSIGAYEQAIQLMPMNDSDFLEFMYNAGVGALQRFEVTGNLSDIDQSISMLEIVVTGTQGSDTDMPSRLNRLGDAYVHRFRRTGNFPDISEAISYNQRALDITPEGHPGIPNRLNGLGRSYLHCFHHTGDLADISRAVSILLNAIHHATGGNPNLPDMLNNLGNSYLRRFEQTGELLDISEAILSLQKAVHVTSEVHPDMPTWLNDLGLAYECRFERTRDLTDIYEAIMVQQKAVHLTSEDNPNLFDRLNNLGISYLQRFDNTGDLADLAEAISAHQKAVELAPEGHPNLPGHLNNLGNSYMRRFERGGDAADLSKAMAAHKKGLALIPEGHPSEPSLLNSLGMSYSWHCENTGNVDDISDQISITQRAVDLTPEGHVDMPSRLINLALSYLQHFKATQDFADIYVAISHYRKAATYVSGSPTQRLKAAKGWAEFTQLLDPSSSEILDAYDTAIQLVPQIASLEQTIQQRHSNLLSISDLSVTAAAAALSLGRPDTALSWLEQGRCFVWNQINNLRTPIDDLRSRDPTLADRFLKVSRDLENSSSRSESTIPLTKMNNLAQKMSSSEDANTHIKLARERDQLLSQIRSIPEFQDFLKPRLASDILEYLPSAGPVIVINVHEDRCDALALLCGSDTPIHIPLETFSYKQAHRLRDELSSHLLSQGVRMREVESRALRSYVPASKGGNGLHKILRELWVCVVKPVLDNLAFSVSKMPLLQAVSFN